MDRRRALKWIGATAGALAAGGFARYRLLPPSPSSNESLQSARELSIALYNSLDSEARAEACVEYEHPLRQYHNRGVWGGGVSGFSLSWEQRGILTDLLHAGLSEQGRARLPREYYVQWAGVHAAKVLFCGDPSDAQHQVILTGPHFNLRIGGTSREGVAFGGPQVYGDQRGDGRQGLPGNLFRYQFEQGHRLYASLAPAQQARAVLEESPIQTQIELQGRAGAFPGIPIAELSKDSRTLAREVVDGILGNYPIEDAAYAWRCLEENGGVETMSLSYYREGEVAQSGQFQIFRLEGPVAVFYFRGYPHVHAFLNVAMNADAPLSVGEELGVNPAVLEKDRLKALFEAAMREETGAELAYYDLEAVVGRLRAGTIRTGDIYNLESWQDFVEVAEIRSPRLPGAHPGRTYRVALADEDGAVELGEVRAREPRRGVRLREAVIQYVKKHGFTA